MKLDFEKSPFHLNENDREWVKETFEKLDVKEKVGQLFVINSNFSSKKNLKDLLQYKPGGVFLSMHLKGHQRRATNFLQKQSDIPLLVAGDLEMGGFGGSLNATMFSTQMGVGATNDAEIAYKFGQLVGIEGTSMGFNWTYSPVVDINFNHMNPIVNVRSFGDNPDLVLKMSRAYIKGIQDAGMIATAKHWPGDGVDGRNQHYVTTHNSLSWEEWMDSFGKVYKGLIDSGVRTIMSAHIDLPAYHRKLHLNDDIKNTLPGSLSYDLNVKLLREELGFNGLIVSDATGMIGMTSHGTREELVPKVINAGNDMFLFAHGREGDFNRMLTSVETGVITQERLDEAVLRILALKASIKLHEKQKSGNLILPKKEIKKIGSKIHKDWAQECAQKSITLVKDTQNILPVNPQERPNILLLRGGDFGFFTRKFKTLLKKKGFKVKDYKKGIKVTPDNFDLVIYLVTEPGFYSKNSILMKWNQIGGMHWFAETVPTIFISLASPYHLYEMPKMKTLINAYAPFPAVQKEVVEKLLGNKPFIGKSPVDPYCGLFDAR